MSGSHNFTSRTPLRIARETSKLVSGRDSNSISQAWKLNQQSARRNAGDTNRISQLERRVNALQQGRRTGDLLHPFQIYQFPRGMRRFFDDTMWRRIKVRGGYIQKNLATDKYIVPGTDKDLIPEERYDLYQIPPGDNTLVSGTWNEALIPNDSFQYTVWISSCIPTGGGESATGILVGKSKINAFALETGNLVTDPWANYPLNDPYHLVIGTVTVVSGFSARLDISQLVHENVHGYGMLTGNNYVSAPNINLVTLPVMRFRGVYQSTAHYYLGDVVVEDSGTADTNHNVRTVYVNFPPQSSAYQPSLGSISGVDPISNSPDPWFMMCSGPQFGAWQTGAYDSSKYYFRNT